MVTELREIPCYYHRTFPRFNSVVGLTFISGLSSLSLVAL